MTPSIHTRASFAAAFLFGIAIGALYGSWRSAADLAALDRDLAVMSARARDCEATGTEATRQLAAECVTASAACAQVAISATEIESTARHFLNLGVRQVAP